MSLVSGPGRAGSAGMPDELQLYVDKHVRYIQTLDKVRSGFVITQPCSEQPSR